MNGTRNNDWLLLTTGVALAGAFAQAPIVSLAAALVAILTMGRPSGFRWATVTGPSLFASDGTPRKAPSNVVFQGFLGGGDGSSTPTSDEEEAAEDQDGSQSYEEFAANLEDDDDEEISFMPHYASDVVEPRSATSDENGSKGSDSLLSDDLQEVEDLVSKLPVSRRFALGTVAIIRRLLEPAQVEQILVEQRRYPRMRFGDIAVQLDLLTESEVQELLVAQEEGIFSDEEISDARKRLSSYHNG